MNNRKVLLIDSYKIGRKLVSEYLVELGVEEGGIYHAGTIEDAEKAEKKLKRQDIVLSESHILNKNGQRICTSGLLKKLKGKGHIVVLHSASSFHEFNENIQEMILNGLSYTQKSSNHMGCPNEFYKTLLEPALALAGKD